MAEVRGKEVLIPPSLHIDLSKIAAMQLTGVQDVVITVLKKYVEENQALLKEYAKVWK